MHDPDLATGIRGGAWTHSYSSSAPDIPSGGCRQVGVIAPQTKVSSMTKGSPSGNRLQQDVHHKTHCCLGIIHQWGQKRCKQLDNNMSMVTRLILLDLGIRKASRAQKGFLQEGRETFMLTPILGQKLTGVWAQQEHGTKPLEWLVKNLSCRCLRLLSNN